MLVQKPAQMNKLESYKGPFEPDFRLERLTRAALGRLGREYMLFGHLHDRGIMPLVASRFGSKAMTDVACDEWIGSSPIYNQRIRDQLGIQGDGVSAILKGLQLDVGFPHQYMDVGYEVIDESRGYFWLDHCGAFKDVYKHSGGKEAAIIQLCHHMEDTTFDATVTAVNPHARCLAEHRPPLQIGQTGPTCRWRVVIVPDAAAVEELEITRRIRRTRAANFEYAELEDGSGEGMLDYRGPLKPDFVLEDLAQPVLARQCKEFALDVHLLMRAAFMSIRERWGEKVAAEVAPEHWAALAPVYIPRVRAALGIEGDNMASILKTLQLDPAFPHGYVRLGSELVDGNHGRFWIEECEAFAAGEPDAWLALLEEPEGPGFDAVVAAVNPRARCRPVRPDEVQTAGRKIHLAWEIRIDEASEPRQESPLANIVRASNAHSFAFSLR